MIVENQAQCKKCKEILTSSIEGDRVICQCGSLVIDGGKNKLVREGDYIELSTYYLTE
jgi:hypothetical protein